MKLRQTVRVWLLNFEGNNLKQYTSNMTPSLVQTYSFDSCSNPVHLCSDGINVWVMIKTVVDPTIDTTVSKVVQIDIASSQIVNTFSNDTNPLYNFNFDSFYHETNNDRGNFNNGICSNNVYVAVCNKFNNSITLMDASSGAFVSNFTLPNTYVHEVTINSQYLFVKGNDSILNKISINIIYPITSGTVILPILTPFKTIEGETGCILINGKNLWNGYGPFSTSNNIGTHSMTLITLMVPCFKEDTKILTDCGYLPIQDLKKVIW